MAPSYFPPQLPSQNECHADANRFLGFNHSYDSNTKVRLYP